MRNTEALKHTFFGIITIIAAISLFLIVSEIGIRSFLPEYLWKFRDFGNEWQLDARLGWSQKPNLDITTRSDFGSVIRFRTNEDGLMPYTVKRQKAAGVIRIMIFGDSFVVGREIPPDKTVNADLERILISNKIPAEVINAGVQGYSTDQILLAMEKFVPIYKPDIVVYGLCSNDFGGNMLAESYDIAKPMFILKSDNSLEAHLPVLKNKTNTNIKKKLRRLLQSSALYRLLQPNIFYIRAKFMKWDERNTIGFSDDLYYDPEAVKKIDRNLFVAMLQRMKKISEDNGASFVFYLQPHLGEVWAPHIKLIEKEFHLRHGQYDRYVLQKFLSKIAEENSIPFCPMIDFFIAHQSRGPFHLLPRDHHPNALGYEMVAEVLSEFLMRSGLVNR